jgi:hypothetical protein
MVAVVFVDVISKVGANNRKVRQHSLSDFSDMRHGLDRAAPVRKLVQKVSGGHFLVRGKVQELPAAVGTTVYGNL